MAAARHDYSGHLRHLQSPVATVACCVSPPRELAVETMLALSAAAAVAIVPLHLPHGPGLPAVASTDELPADGAEMLKAAARRQI